MDALQLITHMLRPPLPEVGENTKNQGKDPDVLRKLLRMSGVGVDLNDMSYSEGTESRYDNDSSSVFSRTLQDDSISVGVIQGLQGIRREFTFKLCDMTGRWHRFTIPVSYQDLLREVHRVAPDLVEVTEEETLKENDVTASATATPVSNRVLNSIQENNLSNTPSTPSAMMRKGQNDVNVDDGKMFDLKSHVQIMYEDDERMWTVISSAANLAEAVELAKELEWKNVRIYLKKSDGTPPKQRPLTPKKESNVMPPPMPRTNNIETRHLQESIKSTERRLESLQEWREKSSVETRQTMMEMEGSIRRQIEGIKTRAEKLADDTNAAALKQQQQWSLMHELTMKKIGKLADECSSLDTKVADSVAPFDRKVQSLAEKGKILAEGVDTMSQKFANMTELVKGVETNIESANLKASDASEKAGQAVSRIEEIVNEIESLRQELKEAKIQGEKNESGEKETLNKMFHEKLENIQTSFQEQVKVLKDQIVQGKSDKTDMTNKIGNAFTKISDTTEEFRVKHMRMLEMVATLKAQTAELQNKQKDASGLMSEIRTQMKSGNVDTGVIVEMTKKEMSSKFAEMESMWKKELESMKRDHEAMEKKNEELLSTFEKKTKDQVTQSIEGLKLPNDQLAIGAAAVSIVSIALAMTVSFLTRRK